jgi:ABC-type transport system substrate-binding protein
MGIGKDGTLEPVIAESYTISPDGRTYTFTLREEAVFSDGTPITAEESPICKLERRACLDP